MGFIAPQSNSGTDAPVKSAPDCSPVPRRTVIHFDGDVARRLGHTIVRDALQELHAADAEMRALAENDLEALTGALLTVRKRIREQTRRGMDTDALEILQSMEARHGFTLVAQSDRDWRSVADGINSARGKAVDAWMAVLSGEATVEESMPRGEDGLLLQALTGHSPMQCLEHWARIKGGQRNLKTYEKFHGIAQDLEAILDGQSAEALTPEHVELYADHLRARGNGLGTVRGKLGICVKLLSNCEIPLTVRKAFVDVRPPKSRVGQHSAPRNPFTSEQLGSLLQAVFRDTSLPPDDRVIAALQALAGARLEEICSLRGSQLSWNGRYWCIDFVEADVPTKDAKPASKRPKNEKLKCQDSVRTIPVDVRTVRGLHERLLALKKLVGQGMVFSHLTANVYGLYGGAVGKRLNKRIDDAVGTDRRLVLESLRNTAAPAMRRAGIDADERRLFLGHAPADLHAKHYDLPTTEDLFGAARAVGDMVAKALAGREYPALDGQYRARPHRKARSAGAKVQRSVTLNDRQLDGGLDTAQGGDQDVDRHAAIETADLAIGVPRQNVVDILWNPSRPAQSLKGVPECVENQAPVLNAATLGVAQIAAPPLAPVAGALVEAVGHELGEEPFVPRFAPGIDVALESNTHQLGVDGNDANRGVVLDPGGHAIGADVQQQAMNRVEFDVAQPQLAELLKTTAREQAERRKPRTGIPTTGARSKFCRKDRRRKDQRKLLGAEWPPTGGLALLPRNTQATDMVRLLKSGVDGCLQDGAEVPELLGHRLGVQRRCEQRVPVRGDEPPVNARHGPFDEPVKGLRRRLELDDRPQGAVGVQVAPILEQRDKSMFLGDRGGGSAR